MFGEPDPPAEEAAQPGGDPPPAEVAPPAASDTVNHSDDVLLDDAAVQAAVEQQPGEEGQSAESDGQPVTEGSTERFGFAKKRDIKKAKALADPKRIRTKVVFAILPLTLAIGFAAGAFVCFSYFFGVKTDGVHRAAVNAAKAAEGRVGEKFGEDCEVTFLNVYVKNKTDEYECVVFCSVSGQTASYDNAAFRVVINKRGGDEIQDEFDPAEYGRLSTGNDEERVLAGLMMNYKKEFDRCIAEIRSDGTDWTEISADYINIRIHRENLLIFKLIR
jgi:hypothetical protein